MGQFSNGSEASAYESAYCERCLHNPTEQGAPMCAVWEAHFLYGYWESVNAQAILDTLIPMTKDGGNEQCRMFADIATAMPLFKAARTMMDRAQGKEKM